MDIPAIHLVKSENKNDDSSPLISDALELYLRLKGEGKGKTFIRTANRNVEYIIKVLAINLLDYIPHLMPVSSVIG